MGRKSQFTDEQIIRALREVDAGAKSAEVCRCLGITEKTFYRFLHRLLRRRGFEVNHKRIYRLYREENLGLRRHLIHKVKRDSLAVPDFLLLDVRGRDAFAKAHVPGALCAPLQELQQLSAQLPRDRELVTFCWSHY